MFTLQIHTLNPVVLNAFADVFKLLAASPTASIAYEDRPDVGRETPSASASAQSAAAVFAPGASAIEQNAAKVFAPPPPPNAPGDVQSHMQAPSVGPTSTSTPLVPPPGASSSVANVLVDSTGLPWDARIHAGTKTQTVKAVWKMKKGVDDALVAQVTAELRQLMSIPAKQFVPLNAPPPPSEAAAPSAPVAPAAPLPPAAQQSIVPTNFVEMCTYIEQRKLNSTVVLAICNKHGLHGLGLLTQRPDLVPQIYADFQAL